MPELPEVETIRRGLSKFIIKQKLIRTDVLCEKSFIGAPVNGTVKELRRFGKALIIDLDNDISLMIHLRMTGQLIYDSHSSASSNNLSTKVHRNITNRSTSPSVDPLTVGNRYAAGHPSDNFTATLPNKQTRVILEFEHGTLYFNDQRKFGFIKTLPTSELMNDPFIRKLAKEPWQMTTDEFYTALQKHKRSLIKATILDQSIICGLGNIYADEALFASRIHPQRRSGSITTTEATKLLESARLVMDRSIASGGSTMSTYVKADGSKGDYLEKFAQVFRRENQPCPICGAQIIKIKVAGRGTHVCPRCQLAPTYKQEPVR